MPFTGGGYEVSAGDVDLTTDVSVSAEESDDEYDRGGDMASVSNYDGDLATWREVRSFCCWYPNCKAWSFFSLHIFAFFTILYLLFVGIVLLASSVQVLGGCYGASLLEDNFENPISNVMAGIIASSVFQSSAVTNIMIGSLAGNVLTVQQSIYMAMGANLGNTMINSFFALVHFKSKTALELAIAGATINDIYYVLALMVMLPLEMASNCLYRISVALTSNYNSIGYRWEGLIEIIVTPLTNMLIIPNKEIMEAIVSGEINSCETRYPVFCDGGDETFDTCNAGLIACNENTRSCPIFFNNGATQSNDQVKGAITLLIAMVVIILCLYGMMFLIYRMLVATPVDVIARVTTFNAYLSMLYGCACGLFLGNASATESMLTPFVGVGVIELEQMFPWCLGSNVGFSISTILIALSSGREAFVQVSLANFFFNVFGIIFWFVIPFMRTFPLHGALIFGILSNSWRCFPLIYICVTFFGIPFMLIGIIKLTQDSSTGIKAAGYIALSLLVIMITSGIYWWFRSDGRDKFLTFFSDNDQDDQDYLDNDSRSIDDESTDEETAADGSAPAPPVGILRNRSSVEAPPPLKQSKSTKRGKNITRIRSIKPTTMAVSEEETTDELGTNPLSFIDLICRLPPGMLGRTGSTVTHFKKGSKRKKKSKLKRKGEDG